MSDGMDDAAWTAELDQWKETVRRHLTHAIEFVRLAEELGFTRDEAMALLVSYVEASWSSEE